MTTVDGALKKQYDSFYDGQSEWRKIGAHDKMQNILSLCSALPHEKVLEIGCGEGAILQQMSDHAFSKNLHGVDISESGVASVRGRKIEGLQEVQVYDGYHLPYEDGAMDLVILSHVLEHVEYPRMLLREASRIGRYLFIEVPLEHKWGLGDYVDDGVGHINAYSRFGVRREVQTSGLRILDDALTIPSYAQHTFHGGKKGALQYWIKRIGLSCAPAVASQMFCYYYAVVCEKEA